MNLNMLSGYPRRANINDVFTPRNPKVNQSMYIIRPKHERDLMRSVEGTLHTVLTGESGSGKSWLYKHVAEVQGWRVFHANASNAARYDSVTKVIANAIFQDNSQQLTEYTQTTSAEASAIALGGSIEAERKYEVNHDEVLLRAFESARKQSGQKIALLVIDNLEAIFSKSSLMEELGNIILLVDDPDYAKYDVRILMVGVPSDVIEYYQSAENLESVSNRIDEVPPMTSLKESQIRDFVVKGFVDQLKVELSPGDIDTICDHTNHVTLGIPLRLHEYCRILAYRIQDNDWRYDQTQLAVSDHTFMLGCLKKSYTIINDCMNERDTKVGRRNQVLYVLSLITTTEFDVKFIEQRVREEFPTSTMDRTSIAVGPMLADLSSRKSPLLRRSQKGAIYRFADPRHLMCLRAMLVKTNMGERVQRKTLKR